MIDSNWYTRDLGIRETEIAWCNRKLSALYFCQGSYVKAEEAEKCQRQQSDYETCEEFMSVPANVTESTIRLAYTVDLRFCTSQTHRIFLLLELRFHPR